MLKKKIIQNKGWLIVKWQVFFCKWMDTGQWRPLLLLCRRLLAPPGWPHGPPSLWTGIPTRIRTSHVARQSPEMGNCNPDKVRVTYHRTVLGLPGLNLRQFLLILVWTRPNLEPNNKSFSFFVPWQITLSPRSATETDLEDTLGGEDDATEGDGDDDIAELAVSVFSFLGDLVQVSPFDADSRSSE